MAILTAHTLHRVSLNDDYWWDERAPYCCENEYDGGSFLDYPIRAGWPQVLPLAGRPHFASYDNKFPADDYLLEQFVQTWLFFGLLQEFLGPSFDRYRYIEKNTKKANDATTCTIKWLKHDLDTWINKTTSLRSDSTEQINLYAHIRNCLQAAINVLLVTTNGKHRINFRPETRRLIAATCHFIREAVDIAIPQSWSPYFGPGKLPTFEYYYAYDTLEDCMLRNNWCRSIVAGVRSNFMSVTSIKMLKTMSSPYTESTHASCTRQQCNLLNTNDNAYEPRHMSDQCTCQNIDIDQNSLAQCYRQGAIPLLQFSSTDSSNFTIAVVPSSSKTPYVALSHVWTDGLGNKQKNSLPRCQLLYLWSLLRGLNSMVPWNSAQPETRHLLLWCDTLCVPVEYAPNGERSQIRGLAMQSMRSVYLDSTYTLVLDHSLTAYKLDEIDFIKATLRLFTSPWWTRLWTYQEAVLSKNLLIQFADRAIDIRYIWQAHHDVREDAMLRGIYRDVTSNIMPTMLSLHGFEQPLGSSQQVAYLANIARYVNERRVSDATDEPLCLAILLNLDISQIYAAPKDDRMKVLWTLMPHASHGIPSHIIFNHRQRMNSPGLRWAPTSLLRKSLDPPYVTVADHGNQFPSQLHESGLVVSFPAWEIELIPALPKMSALSLELQQQACIGKDNEVPLRTATGSWLWLNLAESQGLHPRSRTLWETMQSQSRKRTKMMVLTETSVDNDFDLSGLEYGLLTSESDAGPTNSGMAILNSVAVVLVHYFGLYEGKVWSEAYNIATALRKDGIFSEQDNSTTTSGDLGENSTDSTNTDMGLKLLSRIEKAANLAVQDADLARALSHNTTKSVPAEHFAKLIANCFFGKYGMITHSYDTEQRWCID